MMPLHIAILELKMYLLNRAELAFSIALPVALFALMYFSFADDAAFSADAHVVDMDGGAHAREFVRRLDALDEIDVRERTIGEVESELDRSAITMAVAIPAGFSAAIDAGETATLTFMRRGNGGDTGQIVASVARATAQGLAGDVRVARLAFAATSPFGVSQSDASAAAQAALARARQTPPVVVQTRGVSADEGPDLVDRMLPGMIVMFLLFAITLSAQTIVEERRVGTLERLMTTRLSVSGLFIGKFLSGVLRASAQSAVLLALGFAVLRAGGAAEFAQIMALCVCAAAAVSGIGLIIAALARTRDQAIWAAVVFTMSMTIFGGTFFDVSGGALSTVSQFTITRYAVDAMSAILSSGETIADQGVGLAVLGGAAVASLIAARLLFRVSEGGR